MKTEHVKNFVDSLQEVIQLQNDTESPAGQIAERLQAARTEVEINARRLAVARSQEVSQRISDMLKQAEQHEKAAEQHEKDAEHADKNARGAVNGFYGPLAAEILMQRGIHPVKALESRRLATNEAGQAEQIKSEAKQIESAERKAQTLPSGPISLGDMTAENISRSVDALMQALNERRLTI
jgi:hypothetical protein